MDFAPYLKKGENTITTVYISKEGKDIATLLVNEKVVWKNEEFKEVYKDFTYDGDDRTFLKFTANSGTWNVNSSDKTETNQEKHSHKSERTYITPTRIVWKTDNVENAEQLQ